MKKRTIFGIILLFCLVLLSSKVIATDGYCTGGLDWCVDGCVNTLIDTKNCGDCGAICDIGERCEDGYCPLCPEGDVCDGRCVDRLTDSDNCGICGTTCSSGQDCINGDCISSCPHGECDGVCVDFRNEKANCGDCETSCDATQQCISSNCVCNAGLTTCGDSCIDTNTDESNCGSCGNACSVGQICSSGSCVDTCGGVPVVGNKECEGSIGSSTCSSLGFDGGDLSCTDDCKFDISACTDIDGWIVESGNWFVNPSTKHLVGTSTSAVIYSEPFDIKNDTDYTLSASVMNKEGSDRCKIILSLNTTCVDSSNFVKGNCNVPVSNLTFKLDAGTSESKFRNVYISNSPNSINNKYLRGVQLKINVSCESSSSYNIYNISLVEQKYVDDQIHYDNLPSPSDVDSTGCCPINYCWDGQVCRNSLSWMSNSTYNPVWNNISAYNEINGHVNTSNQPDAIGYRCVIVDFSSSEAQWVPSKIKYDWNYKESGYCANNNDCFVNSTYGGEYTQGSSTSSKGCVPNGTITDGTSIDVGNHYCYLGNWTTRSYMVSQVLQNLTQGKNYNLHCYNDSSLVYNNPTSLSAENILSSCVLIINNGNTEQVITGIVLKDDTGFVESLITSYKDFFPGEGIDSSDYTYTCEYSAKGSFIGCINSNSGFTHLKVYYEPTYKFYIISDGDIPGISNVGVLSRFFGVIKTFFSNIFGGATVNSIIPYNSINYTSSYDRLYLLRNGSVNITGIEESKYDEVEQNITNTLFITYSGANDVTNPINGGQILKTVNETVSREGSDLVNVSYVHGSNNQTLIIKTEHSTGLWPYLTSRLRIRQPGTLA